jgi:hypothetical protein
VIGTSGERFLDINMRIFLFQHLQLFLCLRHVVADFDVAAPAVAVTSLQNVMNTPKLTTSVNVEAFKCQHLFDGSVNWEDIRSLFFSQIISNQAFGSYYHHWVGFDDGGFIGYYNKGVVSGASAAVYTISYMLNGNHTCNSSYGIVAPCREYFEADPKTGELRKSFAGADYDCRGRGWYSNAADSRTSRWSSLYIDKTSKQAAFAYCTPLQNLTTNATISRSLIYDTNATKPIIGVACSGMYIDDIAQELKRTYTPRTEGSGVVYVREVSSNGVGVPLPLKDTSLDKIISLLCMYPHFRAVHASPFPFCNPSLFS